MQAPGGPDEDTLGGFSFGGWAVPYFDESLGEIMGGQMEPPFDLLLGRRTYDIFAAYWPDHPEEGAALNKAVKYVVSREKRELKWGPSRLITGNAVREIEKIKSLGGPPLQVHGSSELIQTLLKNDLADELWLKIYPLTLGKGKRLFGEGTVPKAFELTGGRILSSGVAVPNYKKSGEIQTGTFQ